MIDNILKSIKKIVEGERYSFMHVCGTHQETIVKSGIENFLSPLNIFLVQGPGCPVCVIPEKEMLEIIHLSEHNKTICIFGDALRIPTLKGSLERRRADGADIKIVWSIEEAIKIARKQKKEVIFMAIGFETTVPCTAASILNVPPENFSIFNCHKVFTSILEPLINDTMLKIDGFIQPGHVSSIIGIKKFKMLEEKYRIRQVISGFSSSDILLSIYMLLKQIKDGRFNTENEYIRAVKEDGNLKANGMIDSVFEVKDGEWRGFNTVKNGRYVLKKEFKSYDSKEINKDILSDIEYVSEKNKLCRCDFILRGILRPSNCILFGKECSPLNPIGPCMSSNEGSCKIFYDNSSKK